ncbi:MAG: flagellar basal-body rod protein FlgG [Planctomycetes bacterium]|nr:flagellar basal-body rod protein FlgG [Planctomycetota bacterium]
MAITALHSAATGMKAMDTQLDVIANNLANAQTKGFKGSRVNFEDLYYEERQQPGAMNSLGQRSSTGLFVGLGARVSNTQLDMRTGSFEETGRPLDIAIQGDGFFKVQTFTGIGQGEGYTRAGNFFMNNEGQIVLGTLDGPLLDGGYTIPPGSDPNSITITSDGMITVETDGIQQDVGQIQLYKFPNPHGLSLEGGNIYARTEASGGEISGYPMEPGFGRLAQRFLEGSNVDPVRELIGMIRTQRSFELDSQIIKAADENLQVVSRLRR